MATTGKVKNSQRSKAKYESGRESVCYGHFAHTYKTCKRAKNDGTQRRQLQSNQLLVNSYLLELTFKSTFAKTLENNPKKPKNIPEKPILAIHNLCPCYYKKTGVKVEQITNPKKWTCPNEFTESRIEELDKFWPNLSGTFPSNAAFRHYQKFKHGSMALFKEDFHDTTLYLGKKYIRKIEKFMANGGFGNEGTYSCKHYQEKLNQYLNFEARAVYTYIEKVEPEIVDLGKIEILLNLQKKPMDYVKPQSIKDFDTKCFKLQIPSLEHEDYKDEEEGNREDEEED